MKPSGKMRLLKSNKLVLITAVLVVIIAGLTIAMHKSPVDFNAEVKPIFNKHCITCHGGVRRKANFSLLFRSEALSKAESGKFAIIPGDPAHSEMIRRLTLNDPEERMPYRHDPLQPHEINILKRWIKEGAKWGDHWAYVPVKQVDPPKEPSGFLGLFKSKESSWVKNDIDRFIYDKLRQEQLSPSAEADKPTLLRRVSLDLTGLPPSASLADQFLKDSSGTAYERLVDSLLASPHYGEHWAAMWMDVARYADTKGYEADLDRVIWKYRDWLIQAFNADKPYDNFLTEQIAGDLLPNPTDAQYIATAFHRNTLTNDEGGTDNEEFRTSAVLDRVNTTWEGLLGTTFACVQCHSHPYDPFTHDEYYKFVAFFNNTRDEDTQADYPLLRQYSSADSAKMQKLKTWLLQNADEARSKDIIGFLKTWQPSINTLQCDEFTNAALVSSWYAGLRNHGYCRLKNIALDNKTELMYRYRTGKSGGEWAIHLDAPDGPLLQSSKLENSKDDWKLASFSFTPVAGRHNLYITYNNATLADPLATGVLFDWLYFTNPFPGKGKSGYDSAISYFRELNNSKVETTPVMIESSPELKRTTHVFERGNWLVKGKEVQPDVPHSLNPLPNGAPKNRMGLAMWLVDKNNPLTSRTMVNRLWEQMFGVGLVETLEDMGTQGIPPSHRELLDWLAWKFMNDYHWSTKALLKEMVMSATYRQDSRVDPSGLTKDADNKYYSRASRIRLSAEEMRDQSLAASGLLSSKMFGPSVMPWQPQGIWLSPYNGEQWENSHGDDQYRRGLYTFWKRTAPYPSMIAFDGTARTFCTARRIRTNTPLQALTTLNDNAFVETARHLAYRMQNEGGSAPADQLDKGFELIMYKHLSPSKKMALEKLYNEAYAGFKKDQVKTCDMVADADAYAKPATAALVVVANAILNLDEVVSRN